MTFTYAYQFFTPSGALAARIHRDVQDLVTPRPTVAVTGSWLTVKEQMPDRYARALAERGFTAVTFDFSGFGTSPSTPAQGELPSRRSPRSPLSRIADRLLRPAGPGRLRRRRRDPPLPRPSARRGGRIAMTGSSPLPERLAD